MDKVKQYRAYWLERLNGELPVLNLPTNITDQTVDQPTIEDITAHINADLITKFQILVKGQGYSLFTGLVALVNTLLYKYTNQEDIILDNPVLTDNIKNIIALRTRLKGENTFNELLRQVDTTINEARSNQHYLYLYTELLKDLHLQKNSEQGFLSQIAVFMQNEEEIQNWNNHNLAISFTDSDKTLTINIRYNSNIYNTETVRRIAAHFEQLMASVVTSPDTVITKIEYLSDAEKHELLNAFNDTATEFATDKTLIELFEKQVKRNPAAVALIFEGTEFTYSHLNEKANQFGHYLRDTYNIKGDDLIGVKLVRSEWMIISILAVLKSGGAYVPIDPDYPQERIDYVVNDSGCKVLIDDNELEKFNQTVDNYSSENPPHITKPTDVAYVIYTSGSTGKPKGCVLEHIGVINRIEWMWQHYKFDSSDIILQKTTFTFDVSVWELFLPLCWGTKMVLCHKDDIGSPERILSLIKTHQVTCLHFVPSMLNAFIASLFEDKDITDNLSGLRRVITSGEALSVQTVNKWYNKTAVPIQNLYGPTEASVDVTYYPTHKKDTKIPIGKPIWNTQMYVLGNQDQLVPIGITGEICIAGIGLARGYLNRPELTAEKFVLNPFQTGGKMYRTGDIGRWLPDGNIEYMGRKDDQVKIRGYRIELGEIESALQSYPGVESAVVIAKADSDGEKRLLAYLVSTEKNKNSALIRTHLEGQLPEYMVPSTFIWLNELPKTASGKADRNALPEPDRRRPEISVLYKAPKTAEEIKVAGIWSSVLDLDNVGVNDNFFELGGNSLLALKTISQLRIKEGINLSIIKLYQFPTISQILTHLGTSKTHINMRKIIDKQSDEGQDIAIIGMAGKFPGANTIEELWEVLRDGKETTTFFKPEDLDVSIPDEIKKDTDYVSARGIIENAEMFDADFFGINPKLAELMDPQQRVFLEISRDVLEKSGHLPDHYDGTIGVFAGSGNNTYFQNNVLPNTSLINNIGGFQVSTVNEKDYISSRTAYQLDLKGPAVSVFSACSTSLLAIAQAVESLRKNQCDVAIAGGASITSPIHSGHIYQEGAMLSKDGHCRSFDAEATGTVFSDGAGVVLLKTLSAAKADGDTIFGIIKGIGINNDGSNKGSFTAPSTDGQAIAIAMAIEDANIDPSTITYLETHGTGTPLGDPIEIEGLKQAFGEQEANQYCAIGSLKSNMGHLTAAAGVAGVIKATLSLYYKQLLPSINFEKPNPNIDFKNSPFYVNTSLKPWKVMDTRRAGVSSFGVGGTNVHVVLEEHDHEELKNTDEGRKKQLFTWSARSANSLQGYTSDLNSYLSATENINLADAAYTLQTTRAEFQHRRFAVAGSLEELNTALKESVAPVNSLQLKSIPGETVFLFPGQGAQYLQMGADLYKNEPIFQSAIDECALILFAYLDKDIRHIIYPEVVNTTAEKDINDTKYTQPALFVIEYATAKLWMSWGIEPSILCGHSIGEYVAAHLAGVFSLEDGLKLISTRGKLVSGLPKSSMLSVRANATEVEKILPSTLSLAAVNSDKLCVIAGTDDAVDSFAITLDEKGILHRRLLTSHAFHSHLMDPIIPEFTAIVSQIKFNKPQKPIVSTVTGDFMSEAEAQDPLYWAAHLRRTVQFSKALDTVLNQDNPILIECGPGNVCTTLVWQHPRKNEAIAVASLEKNEMNSAYDSILKALGKVWISGLSPIWTDFYKDQKRKKINLPTYYYNKKTSWVNPISVEYRLESTVESLNSNTTVMRKDSLTEKIKNILENASGIEMNSVTPNLSFIEIGLDSLLLTQVAISLKKEFQLPITFRQLNEEYATIESLANYIDKSLPAESYSTPLPNELVADRITSTPVQQSYPNLPQSDSALGLIAQQLQILSKQVGLMTANNQLDYGNPVNQPGPEIITTGPDNSYNDFSNLSDEEKTEIKKPFGASARIERKVLALLPKQLEYLAELTKLYNNKTSKSKAYTQDNRSHMADPRVVSGFKPLTKELIYSIVINKSKGSRFWDIDGNEYIDALNGFGSNMLGYQPDFIKSALIDQIEKGYEIGPQHELAGEVSKLICEFTGFDRSALCNTGSEAVLGALRIARTVTGRSLVVVFSGSYHGIVDEVIVRGSKKHMPFPAAPGIMPEAVQNILILDYGTQESLQIIRERAGELAAILVEPIQSRRPEFQPIEFLKELRLITEKSDTALIFDEVISGFRFHPGGIQGMFGIKADIGTYGKVAGGGISIGIIAGKRKYMDALDGGFWSFGDDSFPEVGVTYFAGTFVRHPLALATTKASLTFLKNQGPQLQENLNEKTRQFSGTLNEICKRLKVPVSVVQFGSLWRLKFKKEYAYSELLFILMRYKGVHILEGFPCFLTVAHNDDDLNKIAYIFEESLQELKNAEFIPDYEHTVFQISESAKYNKFSSPPLPNAKLGKDNNGNPGWFIEDKETPGKYLQIN